MKTNNLQLSDLSKSAAHGTVNEDGLGGASCAAFVPHQGICGSPSLRADRGVRDLKQRINTRETIQYCRKCGDFCIVADGKKSLCPRCNPKKKSVYATALWKILREKIIAKFKGICQTCGLPGDCVDHIKPLSRGGATVEENLSLLCKYCNSKKFFKTNDELKTGKKASYASLV